MKNELVIAKANEYKGAHDLRGLDIGKVCRKGHGWTHVEMKAYAAKPVMLRVHDDGRVQRLYEGVMVMTSRSTWLRDIWQ